jgi:serine protease Do
MSDVDTGFPVVQEAAAQAISSLALLEMPHRQGVGFLLSPGGVLVTNLHVVAGAEELSVLLSDGRFLSVEHVIAFDEKRDLALFQLPVRGVEALRPDAHAPPREGAPLFILHPSPDGQLRLLETRVHAVQELDDTLTFLELEGALPEESSGSPAFDASGAWVGVATCAFADGRPVTIVIPSGYVLPLLERPGTHPLSTLGQARPAASRQRQVPHHSLALLEGCGPDVLEEVALTLLQSIQLGAPLYNRGDPAACYQLYARAAEKLLRERTDCPGVQSALRQGLERCARLDGADGRAWALRDTFDGLIQVIDRWLRAQAALVTRVAPRDYLQ